MMSRKKVVRVIFLTALMLFSAGCMTYARDSSYTMRFSVNETGEPLEGNVYLNGAQLGFASNGIFQTTLEKLRPGLIALNGTYENQPFEVYFEFPLENMNYSGINYSIRAGELKKYLFNGSSLDTARLEHDILDRVNMERSASGIKALKWNDRIVSIARNYSRTLSIQGFHHKDLEGKDACDRLRENRIFYTVAAENLYMIEGMNATVNVAETAVSGWLHSPAHRSPIMDRDELFSDAGVGIYCEKKTCYAVMVFAGLAHSQKVELNPGYLTFLYIYDPSFPFDFDVPVSIEIDSTDYMDIFIIPNREQYDIFLQHGNYRSILEQKRTRNFNNKVVASKGQGIIIQSAGENNAVINIHLTYT
jgi:uncharacterized protein YkwD